MDVLRLYFKKHIAGTTLIETIVSTVIILVAFLLFSMIWAQVLNSGTGATGTKLLYFEMPPTRKDLLENFEHCTLTQENINGQIRYNLSRNNKIMMSWLRIEKGSVIDSLFNL